MKRKEIKVPLNKYIYMQYFTYNLTDMIEKYKNLKYLFHNTPKIPKNAIIHRVELVVANNWWGKNPKIKVIGYRWETDNELNKRIKKKRCKPIT